MKYNQGDAYCYNESSILINIPDIQNQDELDAYEQEFSTLRMLDVPTGDFSADHIRILHEHIFQDTYSWAGEFRNCTLSKGGSLFAQPQYIEQEIDKVSSYIHNTLSDQEHSKEDVATILCHVISELNAAHPFREGNGRVIREFARQLAVELGYFFQVSEIDPEEWLSASIACFNGDDSALHAILLEALEPM